MLLAGTCGHHCSSNPPGQAKQAGQQGRPAAAAAVPHALQHSRAVRCVGKALLDLAEHSSSTATNHPALRRQLPFAAEGTQQSMMRGIRSLWLPPCWGGSPFSERPPE